MSNTVRVIYARKPGDWHEIESCSRYDSGTAYKTEIIETREMTATEYDDFITSPLKSRSWLDGKGGWKNNDTRLAIAITSPGREHYTLIRQALIMAAMSDAKKIY